MGADTMILGGGCSGSVSFSSPSKSDLDPLASLAAWWKRRPRVKPDDPPTIFTGADTASDAVEAAVRAPGQSSSVGR